MKTLYTLFTSMCLLLAVQANGQTYHEQHAECSVAFKNKESLTPGLVADFNECMVGADAPNFIVTTLDGAEIELAKLKGKVVVLNFWSTTCKPCIEEMPALNELVRFYKDANVIFLSLAPENAETLEKFFVRFPFDYTPAADAEKVKSEIFKLQTIVPYSVIIDKEGKIKKMWFGSFPGREHIFSLYTPLIDECLAKR
ncbi:TlpA family protein disulfide reductase [Pontibacter sp. KCTC 32443]|uniref:TlpA family protein disulfide reductase n=1 Tax=Pontibacter TaxID=323449 RepID=UPI00164E1730|nr:MULTISPECIES: TlpA disulfide reductase family protein [Pontibacter]MBC5774805.1 TlpA family protein disulfide reductase [Pontibacter sp. KCTC 32443]